MANPMDRDFGDDPFRRMEKRKFARMLGKPVYDEAGNDIEEPVISCYSP